MIEVVGTLGKITAKYSDKEVDIMAVVTIEFPANQTNMHGLTMLCGKTVTVKITSDQLPLWDREGETRKPEPVTVTFEAAQ